PVPHSLARLKEAAKLGFCRATIPQSPPENGETLVQVLNVESCTHISGLIAKIAAAAGQPV
ncbi:MAG: DNA repair protein RadA, partial [Methylocella sp.]